MVGATDALSLGFQALAYPTRRANRFTTVRTVVRPGVRATNRWTTRTR